MRGLWDTRKPTESWSDSRRLVKAELAWGACSRVRREPISAGSITDEANLPGQRLGDAPARAASASWIADCRVVAIAVAGLRVGRKVKAIVGESRAFRVKQALRVIARKARRVGERYRRH
jgi:hypothetical protein